MINLAGGSAGKVLFPILGADLVVASNVEALINGAITSFAPETKMEYWIADAAIPVAANEASVTGPDPNTLQLPTGVSLFVVFQTGKSDMIDSAIRSIAEEPTFKFDLDRGGALVVMQNGRLVDPNPFANYLYITYQAVVQAV